MASSDHTRRIGQGKLGLGLLPALDAGIDRQNWKDAATDGAAVRNA